MQSYLLFVFFYYINGIDRRTRKKKERQKHKKKNHNLFFIYLSCLQLPSTYIMLNLVHINLEHQLLDQRLTKIESVSLNLLNLDCEQHRFPGRWLRTPYTVVNDRIHAIYAPYTTVFLRITCDSITIVFDRDRIR